MPRRRERERQVARRLRAEGWPLRRIASEVGVALSSVSVWVADISPGRPSHTVHSSAARKRKGQLDRGTRHCGRCKRDLPLTSFNRHPKGRQWWCRKCFRIYFKSRGQLHREQSYEARRRRREAAREFIYEHLRSHPCSDCEEKDPLLLEFDHVGAKRAHVSVLTADGFSIDHIKTEIARCEVVCVNCHRIRTALRGNSWRLDPMRIELDTSLTPGERRNMGYVRDLLITSCCVDCGETRLAVLEFDHIGAKRANVVDLARRGCGMQALLAEISRCEVRCANCHRRRTLQRLDRAMPRVAKEECPRQDSNLQPSP